MAQRLNSKRFEHHMVSHGVVVALLLLLGASDCAAALGGVPEKPVPGRDYPRLWIGVSNDDYGPIDSDHHDDHRTAALHSGARIGQDWLLFFDYGMMTDKVAGLRTDEMSISFGRIVVSDETVPSTALVDWDLAVGVGARFTGDHGGEDIQNDWHELINQEPTVLPYEEADDAYLLWVSSEAVWVADQDPTAWQWGVSVAFRALYSTEGTFKWSPAVHGVVRHEWLDAWAGLRYEGRAGDPDTHTQAVVQEFEADVWASAGVALGRYINLNAGYNFESKESYGVIGLIVPMD